MQKEQCPHTNSDGDFCRAGKNNLKLQGEKPLKGEIMGKEKDTKKDTTKKAAKSPKEKRKEKSEEKNKVY